MSNQAVKTLVMTGGSTGVGLEALKQLSRSQGHGRWRLIIGARNERRLREAASSLRSGDAVASVDTVTVDLASRESTEAFARQVKEKLGAERLDTLVLNAGIANGARKASADGWLEEVVVNHLNQGHLLESFLPVLRREGRDAEPARVIMVGSETHRRASSNTDKLLEVLKGTKEPYDGFEAYAASKWAQMAGCQFWRERLSSPPADEPSNQGIDVLAVSPGWVPATDLARQGAWFMRLLFRYVLPWLPSAVTVPEGGRRILRSIVIPSDEVNADEATGYLVKGDQWSEMEARTRDPQVWKLVVPQAAIV